MPATAKRKKVKLSVPVVETKAHVRVSGKFIGNRLHRDFYERPNDIDFDVSAALEPGKVNQISLRVYTEVEGGGRGVF